MIRLGRNSCGRLACAVAPWLIVLAATAKAAPLGTNAFASLGTLNVTFGTLNIDTETPSINGATSFVTVRDAQRGTFNPAITVFTLDSIEIGNEAVISIVESLFLAAHHCLVAP